MRLDLQIALVIATTLTHTALVLGLTCDSACAACWKDNAPGVDTKFACDPLTGKCGSTCPEGYHWIHCATYARC